MSFLRGSAFTTKRVPLEGGAYERKPMPTNIHYISDDLHYREVVERMVGV